MAHKSFPTNRTLSSSHLSLCSCWWSDARCDDVSSVKRLRDAVFIAFQFRFRLFCGQSAAQSGKRNLSLCQGCNWQWHSQGCGARASHPWERQNGDVASVSFPSNSNCARMFICILCASLRAREDASCCFTEHFQAPLTRGQCWTRVGSTASRRSDGPLAVCYIVEKGTTNNRPRPQIHVHALQVNKKV